MYETGKTAVCYIREEKNNKINKPADESQWGKD